MGEQTMATTWRRIWSVLFVVGALVWGTVLLAAGGFSWGELYHSAGVPVAWAAVVAGIAAWESRPENRTGPLLIAFGFAGLVRSLQATAHPLPFTVGSFLADVPGVLLIYLLLSYPRGVLRTVPERAAFWITVAAGAFGLTGTVFYDPRDLGCADCPPGLNLGLIARDPEMLSAFLRIGGILYVVSGLMVLAIMALRSVGATPPARRIVWPVALPALVILIDGIIGRTWFWILQQPMQFPTWFVAVQLATRILLPFSILFGLLRLRLRRSRLGDLVVELGGLRTPDRVRDAVARTLGDATADVAFWSEGANTYLTSDGQAVALPDDEEDRAATYLEHDGGPLAVILHDPALRDDPRLLDAVAAAASLAVDNERLQAEILAQLDNVRRSRAHIVEAADAERRRVERDLHDGAQQRLVSLAIALRMAESRAATLDDARLTSELAGASQELDRAIGELRELARGIYPPVLVQEGLAAALQELAERSPIPVRLRRVEERFDQDVETTAYFVASEALTNAAKHSFASEISIEVSYEREALVMHVEDDGIGGADPTGAGLRGLSDRVDAVDGVLTVNSRPGRGTELAVRIPCASSLPTTQH